MNIPKTLENKIRILQFKLNEFVDSTNLKKIENNSKEKVFNCFKENFVEGA